MSRKLMTLIGSTIILFVAYILLFNATTEYNSLDGIQFMLIIPAYIICALFIGFLGGSIAAWIHVSESRRKNQESHGRKVFYTNLVTYFFIFSLVFMLFLIYNRIAEKFF